MRNMNFAKTIGALVLLAGVAGCGEEGGGSVGGSFCGDGSSSGLCLSISSVSAREGDVGEGTLTFDMIQGSCPGGTAEPFFDVVADLEIQVRLLPQGQQSTRRVFVQDYRIEYRLIDGDGAPTLTPLSSSLISQGSTAIEIPAGATLATTTHTVIFMPTSRKGEFVSGQAFPTNVVIGPPGELGSVYSLTVIIRGVDEYNNPVSASATRSFILDNYNNC